MTGIPHPFVTALIALLWMFLTSFSLGQLLLGLLVGLIAGIGFARLTPDRVRLRRPDLIAVLAGRVSWDIAKSNYATARSLLLDPNSRKRRSGFVKIPLELTEPNALATLAIIITSTPGTAWIDYDPKRKELLLHVFDLLETDDWVHLIKSRYETPLLEIFG